MVKITSSKNVTAIKFTSHLLLVRLLLATTAVTVLVNFLFWSPLESTFSSTQPTTIQSHKNVNVNININNQTKASPALHPNQQNANNNDNNDKQHILDIFQEAGVQLTPAMIYNLPTWSQVQQLIGTHPYVVGLEHCPTFQDTVPPLERMLGSAGMFNTGTNLVSHLLKQNCEIPERRKAMGPGQTKESYGMRWQVPWGKHTPAKYRQDHSTSRAVNITKEYILPVVTIRNPYTWFRSMCHNPYSARWDHSRTDPHACPSLKDSSSSSGKWHTVKVKYGAGEENHTSLAHLWNDWYAGYIHEATFPFIAVRLEDLVFYPKETTQIICECAGGVIRTDKTFSYVVDSAKADSKGHDISTGIYTAWMKYSKRPERKGGFSDLDYETSKAVLDPTLMEAFGYQHPPP